MSFLWSQPNDGRSEGSEASGGQLAHAPTRDVAMTSESSGTGATGRNAPDGTAHIRELLRATLRTALRLDAHGGARDGEVRRMLQQGCDAARSRNVRAEQVLILLKETWNELPEARPAPHFDTGPTLTRVISLCIKEYYAPRESPDIRTR